MPTKKLFLLDAMALIYRAHFAFNKNPRITSKGMNTSATFGFLNTLLEVLHKEKPTHIGVGFDTAAPTFRHAAFAAYKAQRQAQPEDISVAIPYVKRLVEALDIPILIMDGYEADDIIGTVAKKAAREGFEVYMMTPDKDYGQLVEEHIHIYKPAFMGKGAEVLGVKEVLERWNIKSVDQVIDMLGLQGDASDNIPGIPGIGEKTAQKLIEEFGTLENIIANASQLKGKLKDNIIQFAEQGLLSKQLATIDIHVPVPYEAEKLCCSEPHKDQLATLLDELEFRTIKNRLLGEESSASKASRPAEPKTRKAVAAAAGSQQLGLFGAPATSETAVLEGEGFADVLGLDTADQPTFGTEKDTIDTVVHEYHEVNTPALRQSLIHYLSKQDSFCFDTETTSVDAVGAELVGLSFAYRKGEAFYVPVPADRDAAQQIVDEFKGVLENPAIGKIAQNLKYDMIVLMQYGVEIKGELYDTMLAHYLVEPDSRHNMDWLAERYLNYIPVSITTLIGKNGPKQLTMREVDVAKVTEYAAEDADVTWQLREVFNPLLQERKATKLFTDVEMPLVEVLASIELEGVRIDPLALKELSLVLETDISNLEQQVFEMAGEKFNIGSPKQLGDILFDKMKLDPKAKKTKTGQYATGEEILSQLEDTHEIVRKILDFRELQKLKSTYIDALPKLVSPRDGRVHTSFNQAVTATGRLSSTNPNLQNIPIRTERGREIRKAFVARNEDYILLSADYSQIELRIIAAFSGDQSMITAFQNNIDIHVATASKVFKVKLEEVTSEMRRKAKMVNFGIIYGISAFGLARRLNVPRREAGEIIDAYFTEFPTIKQYMDDVINRARDHHYVETLLGRRRYLRDINSRNQTDRTFAERNAINAPIQGTAADMIKLAMIRIHAFIKQEKLRSRMILQVHDELLFDVHRDELAILKPRIEELMKNALPLVVPMEIGIGTGVNWLEAH
ncbi:MAG: DNA polymerase I [Bacteroidota bacterium]